LTRKRESKKKSEQPDEEEEKKGVGLRGVAGPGVSGMRFPIVC